MLSTFLLICAIPLSNVQGDNLRARAFFDANNVRVGDPLVLSVDFIGSASFENLHPPALMRLVESRDWKIDDLSAKTQTFPAMRRLTYRVRPMREGVLVFPSLEFSYEDARSPSNGVKFVRTNEIPVHAKKGDQVALQEIHDEALAFPAPPPLVLDPAAYAPALVLSKDDTFLWEKACAAPSTNAFAAFSFPAARLNEASCALEAKNWARALDIYRRLEWRIGQTPEIEQGILAALALKSDSPNVELPVWRETLRPILRFGWMGRVALFLGGLSLFALLLFLLNRLIRLVACVTLVLLAGSLQAETVETVTTNSDGSVTHRKVVTSGNGNFSYSFTSSTSSFSSSAPSPSMPRPSQDLFQSFFGESPFAASDSQREDVKGMRASLAPTRREVMVGEDFDLVLSLDQSKRLAPGDMKLSIREQDEGKLVLTGPARVLVDAKSANPTNVVKRWAIPARATAPFEGLQFSVSGTVYAQRSAGFFATRFPMPFEMSPRTVGLSVSDLPLEGRGEDFFGIVATRVTVEEKCDLKNVGTNDVVTISYILKASGFVPDTTPKDVAYEWQRETSPRETTVEYRRYFVADPTKTATPDWTVSYFDPREKAYKRLRVGATPYSFAP